MATPTPAFAPNPSAMDLEALIPQVYDHLRRLAGSLFVGERAITLQPTALVHDAYLKLASFDRLRFRNRQHFFAIAARVLRQVLLDAARERRRSKRGGGVIRVALDDETVVTTAGAPDLLALDAALHELARVAPQQAELVELRYFGGLTIPETAVAMSLSPASVVRRWRLARAWLFETLEGEV